MEASNQQGMVIMIEREYVVIQANYDYGIFLFGKKGGINAYLIFESSTWGETLDGYLEDRIQKATNDLLQITGSKATEDSKRVTVSGIYQQNLAKKEFNVVSTLTNIKKYPCERKVKALQPLKGSKSRKKLNKTEKGNQESQQKATSEDNYTKTDNTNNLSSNINDHRSTADEATLHSSDLKTSAGSKKRKYTRRNPEGKKAKEKGLKTSKESKQIKEQRSEIGEMSRTQELYPLMTTQKFLYENNSVGYVQQMNFQSQNLYNGHVQSYPIDVVNEFHHYVPQQNYFYDTQQVVPPQYHNIQETMPALHDFGEQADTNYKQEGDKTYFELQRPEDYYYNIQPKVPMLHDIEEKADTNYNQEGGKTYTELQSAGDYYSTQPTVSECHDIENNGDNNYKQEGDKTYFELQVQRAEDDNGMESVDKSTKEADNGLAIHAPLVTNDDEPPSFKTFETFMENQISLVNQYEEPYQTPTWNNETTVLDIEQNQSGIYYNPNNYLQL